MKPSFRPWSGRSSTARATMRLLGKNGSPATRFLLRLLPPVKYQRYQLLNGKGGRRAIKDFNEDLDPAKWDVDVNAKYAAKWSSWEPMEENALLVVDGVSIPKAQFLDEVKETVFKARSSSIHTMLQFGALVIAYGTWAFSPSTAENVAKCLEDPEIRKEVQVWVTQGLQNAVVEEEALVKGFMRSSTLEALKTQKPWWKRLKNWFKGGNGGLQGGGSA